MTSPWQYACPEGHRSVHPRNSARSRDGGNDWYCYACVEGYDDAEVVDLTTASDAERKEVGAL